MNRYGYYPHRLAFLRNASSSRKFLRHLERYFPARSAEYRVLAKAHDLTEELFQDEYRLSGDQYIVHPRRVALIALERVGVRGANTLAACIMHDNREFSEEKGLDTWDNEFVEKEFNFGVEVLVAAVTAPRAKEGRSSSESHHLYHERFRVLAPQRILFEVKLPDRHDNLLTLSCDIMPHEQVAAKIAETEKHYMPFARRHIILDDEMKKVLAWHRMKLKMSR